MYAAVSGLRAHQTMMDVVGNNIANVNTHGYKKSDAIFHDVLSQVINGAGAPTEAVGGSNPAQVGLGTTLGAIAQNFANGALQNTNRDLDMALQGDGFFSLVEDGVQLYTRAGSFFLDANNNLVSSGGAFVQGWMADATGEVVTSGASGQITIPVGEQAAPITTSSVNLGGNLPAEAAVGETQVSSLNIYDSQGKTITLELTFTKTATDTWQMTATYGDPPTPVTVTDSQLQFGADGRMVAPADFDANIAAGSIPNVGDVALTFGGLAAGEVTQVAAAGSISAIAQDGAATGQLLGVTVGQDGTITGAYSNGRVKAIAQVAVVAFSNPEGLERVSGTMWRASVNSGLAQIGTASTGGRGQIAPGTLEMSNVDLAEEFTTLIRTQRGFQANSRVITTSDEMLQEVVNLKR
ncbi:MAG: flagellar hook protein FlgE [Acidimicrobiia bacterium]|nr:flagellar hook protein FlgE [Acidimicrobiia bacterium]